MTLFSREKPPAKSEIVSLRATPAEVEQMDQLAELMGLKSRDELLRKALEFYVAVGPEAVKAARSLNTKKKGSK